MNNETDFLNLSVNNTPQAGPTNQPEIHEVVYLFPRMSETEFAELKADIAQHGLQMPILRYRGKVVDGANRLKACIELGIIPRFEELQAANDDDMKAMVVSLNFHRRNLDLHQRALIAARLCNTQIGTNQHSAGAVSQAQLAQDLAVSTDSIARGKTIINKGSPELIAAVEAGKLDLSNAARLAGLSRQDQSQINFDDLKEIQKLSKEINKAKFAARREARAQEIEAKRANNKPLNASLGTYSVIYADPPWNYMGEMAVGYPCMSTQEICDMPVQDICTEDAVLFMWCSASLLSDALQVIKAWGFTFKTSAVWDKGVAGQGAYFRMAHEVLTISCKGTVPEVPFSARPMSVLTYPRLEHSRKPPELYAVIEAMYPELSKVELFCRGDAAPGWAGWGNECTWKPEAQHDQDNSSTDNP
jgi:N6-adenosine-specific RNA methylase IME4/ParB-like chromosome segregation protein Spo0J